MTATTRSDTQARAERAYLENRVQGANPQELLAMLYQGLIQSTQLGREALRAERWDQAQAELSKARRIITYLGNSLQAEGGEITDRLRQLYGFCLEQIVRANLERQADLLDGVLDVVQELGGAWTELAQGPQLATDEGETDQGGQE